MEEGRHSMSCNMLCSAVALVLAVSFRVANAAPAPLQTSAAADYVTAVNCRVKFVERRTLSVERPGILSEAAREGERVQAQQVVLKVYDAVPKSARDVAKARAENEADVDAAKIEQDAAEFEHQTHLMANESRPGTYTEIDIRRVQLAAELAAAKVQQAQNELDISRCLLQQAEDELDTYYVRSTISGLVTRAFKGSGEAVQLGEPILEVVNTETVRIEGFVPLADAWRIKVGMPVTVHVDLAGGHEQSPSVERSHTPGSVVAVRGELGFVDVDVQPVAKVVRVWADVPNKDDLLRDGLAAELTIHTADPPPTVQSGTSSR
jgi:hypothetical protein